MDKSRCSVCGAELAPNTAEGSCPACLFQLAFNVRIGSNVDTAGCVSVSAELTIGAEVAQGGMGTVFEARDTSLGRTVDLKVMRGDLAAASRLHRFFREAEVLALLEHPNITPVHCFGRDGTGRPFYSMKLVRGATLRQILDRLRMEDSEALSRFQLVQLLSIFQKVCDAVAFAHSKEIIHRDLKPENVMIGEFGEVLVVDWGLAKMMSRTTGTAENDDADAFWRAELTMEGAVIGTPTAMAPEQASGRVIQHDHRTDIFGLGGILYQILTLRRPILAQRESEGAKDAEGSYIPRPVFDDEDDRPSRVRDRFRLLQCPRGRIPAPLCAVTRKAMAVRPEARYQTVKELQADIAAWQNGYVAIAEAAGWWRQTASFITRHRIAVSTVMFVLLLTVGFTARLAVSERRAQRALADLRTAAPAVYAEAKLLLNERNLEEALTKISFAIQLDKRAGDYHCIKGHILQSLVRLREARDAYAQALIYDAGNSAALTNRLLCERILANLGTNGLPERSHLEQVRLAMIEQGRIPEALHMSDQLKQTDEVYLAQWNQRLSNAGHKGRLRLQRGEIDLTLRGEFITNLAFLRGIPIVRLDLSSNKVVDLSPLGGMKLRDLDISETPVSDLRPLEGMPIEKLTMNRTKVSDLAPLRKMPLKHLCAMEARIIDLSPLKGLPLRYLNLYGNRGISELRPLEGMPLAWLHVYYSKVTDLTPLRNLPLEFLDLDATPAKDLSPLSENSSLFNITASGAPISDINSLLKMPLTQLHLDGTRITNISVLAGKALKTLRLHDCRRLKDVSPLASCRELEFLTLPASATNISLLRQLPRLKRIGYSIHHTTGWNGVSTPAEFWRAFDKEQ